MNVLQLLITIFNYHSGWQVCISIFIFNTIHIILEYFCVFTIIDVHHVTVMSTENRIGAVDFSDQKKEDGIMKLENGKFIPSDDDHQLQRKNFITLVGRIPVANIPCLKFLADVVTSHIPHKYSLQMAKKTNTVSRFTGQSTFLVIITLNSMCQCW